MDNYTVLLALFGRVGQVLLPTVDIMWSQNSSNFCVPLCNLFANPCFLICSVRESYPSKCFCVIPFSRVSRYSAWYLLGKKNGWDWESTLNYCDCTLKYEFCHGGAIIFSTLTLSFPLVRC